MGFNAPSTNDLSRKLTDRKWRMVEQAALKLMADDRDITKAEAIRRALQASK